jgi:sugar phosphate isomerase/epimerase
MSDILDRLSLSTCWCSSRHADGYEMVEEMLSLGFKRIELSHGIRLSLVPGILQAVEEGIVQISSVHNFCPLPNIVQHAAPNLFQPSSKDSRELTLWHSHSKQTLDFAVKVGADRIVMHSGSVSFFFFSPEARLEKWIEKSEISAHELSTNGVFLKRRDRAMKAIRKAAVNTIPRIKENYEKLLLEVKERGLKLCLENREGIEEMPIDTEYDNFLESLGEPKHALYWHDTGHAQIKHQLGLIDHREHLEKMSPRLSGFHLHDVSEAGRDHQVPGTGAIDFNMIAEFVRPEHTLVLELSPRLTSEEVIASRDYLLGVLG